MASWFTRALDKVTPWRRGGELQREEEERKRREQQQQQNWNNNRSSSAPNISVGVARPTQNISVDQPKQPKPQKPVNIFDVNKNLVLNKPQNMLDIVKSEATKPYEAPKPGTVVQPRVKVENFADNRKITLPKAPKLTPEQQAKQTLERELDAVKSWEDIARDNNFDLNAVKQYSEATRPNYGVKIEKPKQGLGNRFRDIFDANTEADKWRRQEGNRIKGETKDITLRNPGNIVSRTPVVGTVTKMANTAVNQARQIPSTIEGAIYTNMQSRLTKEMLDAQKRGDRAAYLEAKRKLDLLAPEISKINEQQSAEYERFEKNSGGLFNAGTLYDEEGARRGDLKTGALDIALPTAVAGLDIYTLGKGAAIEQAIRQGGIKALGTRAVLPNVAKASAGNFGSGSLDTVSQGGDADDAVKSGLLNTIFGLVPDIGLPAIGRGFRSRILPKIRRGQSVNPADVLEELDDAAISASAEAASEALKPRPIPVRAVEDIPVRAPEVLPQPITVRNLNEPGQLIQEFPGDASIATPDALIRKNAEDARADALRDAAFDQAKTAPKPNPAIEGVTPRAPEAPYSLDTKVATSSQDKLIDDYAALLKDMGEGNGVDLIPDGEAYGFGKKRVSNNVRFGDTKGKRMTKAMWRDEAERQLRAGEAEPGIQQAFNDSADPEIQSMLNRGEQPPAPEGRPIKVKQAQGIPVRDETVVPTDLPETPGQVRATSATAPSNAKSEAIANAPVAAAPVKLPAEVQEVLDNPKQFNKRQVQAARNQRKMARAVAKANEDTAEALERIETASPAAQSGEGFVPTGEFGTSVNRGSYQKASRAAEMAQAVQETANMSPTDVIQTARNTQREVGAFSRRDIRNIAAMFEQKRLPRGSAEWKEARQILKEDGTTWGQTGALRNYTMRRTATANELISRYESKIYKLAEDPSKIDSKLFDQVEAAEDLYVKTRDDALQAYNRFTENPTSANAKAYHAAQDAAEKADVAAKQTEFAVANKVLKGNKDVAQVRELEKMAQAADMYQMDAVDASMLSGTGTFIRNFANASVSGAEEGLFGRPAAWISRKLTGESVGGGILGRGSVDSARKGARNVVDASKARASNAGKNPLEHIKNWATTGNQLGDTVLDAQAAKNTLNHYREMLRSQGYKGRELTDRASVMARQDPDDIGKTYSQVARTAAGLGAGITRNNKIETFVKNLISDTISAGKPGRVSEGIAKLITRMTIGFPTAIGRSTAEGVKRFTLGAPTFIKAIRASDPQTRAILIKEGIKQAGTGSAVIPPLFYALGASEMITGSYPDSKEERARWEREGITENSIKIGDAYYQLPAYLGAWAVPGLFYASLGRNDGDWGKATTDVAGIIPDLLPADQASRIIDVVEGDYPFDKYASQVGASAVRATTPAGALLNQIAKSFDSTKNDTTGGTELENFVNRVLGGIPGVNNMANIPDKVDDAGNPIQNPNAAELLFGAASASQNKGIERSGEIQEQVNDALQRMTDIGAIGDPNLREILSDEDKLLYDKAASGELSEGELQDVQEALVKGVSQEGTDTAYLEREQYDTHLAALKMKKQLMESDKTVAPSKLKNIETAIKRGEVYKELELPYEMIDAYQSVGVEDWRKMGIPPGDKGHDEDLYDPDMYEKLWQIDQKLTKAGGSYKKGDPEKNKYYLKEKKSGSGRGGSKRIDTSFGTLDAGSFAPRLRAYDTIDQQTGSIPTIRRTRSNIVHKISASR